MDEGITRHLLPQKIGVYSAGSEPTGVNPYAIRVMQEIGIDISKQASKTIDDIPKEQIATVVTLCAEQVCPFFPGNIKRLYWPIKDPTAITGTEEEILQAFRKIRDKIARKIEMAHFVKG